MTRVGLDSQIARNSFYLMAAEATGRLINLLVAILLFRYLGPELRGSLGFVITYGILFGFLGELGVTRAAIRHVSRVPESLPEMMGTLLKTRLLIVMLAFGLMNLSLLTPLAAGMKAEERTGVMIWSLVIVFQAFRRNSSTVFLALQKMHFHAALVIANHLITALVIVYAVWRGYGLTAIFVAYLIGDMVDALLAGYLVRRRFSRPSWNWSLRPVIQLLQVGFPFALHIVAAQICYYMDVLMLRYFYPLPTAQVDQEIGFYQAAYQVVLALMFIPSNIMNALFPALSKSYRDDPDRLRSLVSYGSRLLVLAGIPVSIFFFAFRREYLGGVLGPAYLAATPILELIVWTLPAVFLTALVSTLLAAGDRQSYVSGAWLMMALFNVTANFFLIPQHGGAGAAVATLATEVVGFFMMFALCLRIWPDFFPLRTYFPMLAFHAAGVTLLLAADAMHPLIRFAAWLLYAVPAAFWARRLYRQRRGQVSAA